MELKKKVIVAVKRRIKDATLKAGTNVLFVQSSTTILQDMGKRKTPDIEVVDGPKPVPEEFLYMEIQPTVDIEHALKTAVEKKHLEIALIFLMRGGINRASVPFACLACELGRADLLHIALGAEDFPLVTNERDETPLHIAVQSNQIACVKFLLQTGRISVNAVQCNGLTPLHYASSPIDCLEKTWNQESMMDMVSLLLQHGADTMIEDHNHRIPMHHLCYCLKNVIQACGTLPSIDLGIKTLRLLCRDGDVSNLIDVSGLTPFEILCFVENRDMKVNLFSEVIQLENSWEFIIGKRGFYRIVRMIVRGLEFEIDKNPPLDFLTGALEVVSDMHQDSETFRARMNEMRSWLLKKICKAVNAIQKKESSVFKDDADLNLFVLPTNSFMCSLCHTNYPDTALYCGHVCCRTCWNTYTKYTRKGRCFKCQRYSVDTRSLYLF